MFLLYTLFILELKNILINMLSNRRESQYLPLLLHPNPPCTRHPQNIPKQVLFMQDVPVHHSSQSHVHHSGPPNPYRPQPRMPSRVCRECCVRW